MPVFTDYPTTKQTSLNDILGPLSSMQQYQQAKQLNPIQLQAAQLQLEQAQKMNPLTLHSKQMEIDQAQKMNPLEVFAKQLSTTKSAGTLQSEITQSQEAAKQAQISTKKSIFDLSKEQSGDLNKIYSSLIGDPRLTGQNVTKDTASQALHEADLMANRLDLGENKDVIIKGLTGPLYNLAVTNPQKVHDALININKSQMTPTERQSFVSGNQAVGGSDIYGNPTVYKTNPYTGQKTQEPLQIAPGTNQNQMRFAPGESSETLKTLQDERNTAKISASSAAPAINNIDTVLKYLPLAQVGKYSDALSGLQSAFGNIAGSTKEELAASARDIIQKNIADLSLQKNAALGGKFVADLQSAQQSLADAGKNPTAIIKSMEQLRPLIQHTQLYQQGLENTITKHGGDVQVKRQYDNAMIKAFDPKALMIYNSYKTDGNVGLAKATQGMTAEQKTEIFNKIKNYSKLVNGDL